LQEKHFIAVFLCELSRVLYPKKCFRILYLSGNFVQIFCLQFFICILQFILNFYHERPQNRGGKRACSLGNWFQEPKISRKPEVSSLMI